MNIFALLRIKTLVEWVDLPELCSNICEMISITHVLLMDDDAVISPEAIERNLYIIDPA